MANAPSAQGFLGSGMSEPVKAFAPGNISGVFKVIPDDDPARMHSLGLGLTIAEGVNVEVGHDDAGNSVFFNGEPVEFPTVASVVERLSLGPVRVTIESPLPLSCGFGLSGASSTGHGVWSQRTHGTWSFTGRSGDGGPRLRG